MKRVSVKTVDRWGQTKYQTQVSSGSKFLHNEDGPALINEHGNEFYYLLGYRYNTKEEWEWCVKHIDKLKFNDVRNYEIMCPKLQVEFKLKFG